MTYKAAVNTADGRFEVELECSIHGRYIPATRIDPEEWPDVEWEIVSAVDDHGDEVTDAETLESIRRKLVQDQVDMDILSGESELIEYEADERRVRMRDEGF